MSTLTVGDYVTCGRRGYWQIADIFSAPDTWTPSKIVQKARLKKLFDGEGWKLKRPRPIEINLDYCYKVNKKNLEAEIQYMEEHIQRIKDNLIPLAK